IISGTEGHASVVDNHLYYKCKKVTGADGKEPFTDLPKAPRAPMHQFLDAVGGAKDMPLVTPREAAARVVAMEAMYKGARERKWVKVGLLTVYRTRRWSGRLPRRRNFRTKAPAVSGCGTRLRCCGPGAGCGRGPGH